MDATTEAIIRGEAAHQATRGNRQAALDLLEALASSQASGAVAVLRAKVLAQHGDFTRAAESFRAALAANSDDQDAKRGLALAEALARSPIGRLRLHSRRWSALLLVLAAAAGLVWATTGVNRGPSNRELADALERIERQRTADGQVAIVRTEGIINDLRQLIEADRNRLQALLTEQTRTSAQARDQLRRLDRQTATLVEAVRRLGNSSASGPASVRLPDPR